MADDEIERLLKEVEAELGRPAPASSALPAAPTRDAASAPRHSLTERLRAGVPRGVVVGAVWGLVVGGAFSVLPVVDGLSGALAGFVTGFGVSLAGRLRRR